LAAGELTLVTIPSVEREQLRDLVRCREDIRADLMRARHRIGKFLLLREIYYEGPGEAWSRKHRSWLTSVLIARRDQVEAELAKLALSARCAPTVARLRCLRGIDTLSALGLCAEIGEWGRVGPPEGFAGCAHGHCLATNRGVVVREPGCSGRLASRNGKVLDGCWVSASW
jgi:hypothetical protein